MSVVRVIYFQQRRGRKVKQDLENLYYRLPLFQMNRLIISCRQAYVEFPIEASAGPKPH